MICFQIGKLGNVDPIMECILSSKCYDELSLRNMVSGVIFYSFLFFSELPQWNTCPSVNVDPDLNCTCNFGSDFHPPSTYKMQVFSIGFQGDCVPSEIFSIETGFEIG